MAPLAYSVLEQALIACTSNLVRHLWIGLPGRRLQDASFLAIAHDLVELQQAGRLEQVTLQCQVADLCTIEVSPILHGFNLSLLVCEAPTCGVDPPRLIICTYLRMRSLFHRVSLTDPSPFTCTHGFNTGSGIRQECLIHPHLLFVLPTGHVQACPLGRFLPLGNLASESLSAILARYRDNPLQFPVRCPSAPKAVRPNICADCLAET